MQWWLGIVIVNWDVQFAPSRRSLPEKKTISLYYVFSFLLVKRTEEKKATQPQALSPYNPTAGYPLDVNSGNKASICCLYEVGTEKRHKGMDRASHTHSRENIMYVIVLTYSHLVNTLQWRVWAILLRQQFKSGQSSHQYLNYWHAVATKSQYLLSEIPAVMFLQHLWC